MTVAPATATALRDEFVAALTRDCPACPSLVVVNRGLMAIEIVRYPLDYAGIARREQANAEALIPSVWYVDAGGGYISLIERQLDNETANYRYGDVFDVTNEPERPWRMWLKVAGCGRC